MRTCLHHELLWSAALQVVLVAGCGATGDGLARVPVRGTVTLDGKPIANGSIQFVPESAGTATEVGATIKDGGFSIPADNGAVPGKYVVRIYSNSAEMAMPEEGIPGSPHPMPKELIPDKYNTKTTLSAEVTSSGVNPSEFKLESK